MKNVISVLILHWTSNSIPIEIHISTLLET
jgi:hypothetical protein